MRSCISLLAVATLALGACRSGDKTPDVPASKVVTSAGRPSDLDLSPDGKRLAWVASVGAKARIFTANADGSNPVPLTSDYSGGPVWSPDGKFIAYVNGNEDIFVIPSGGGTPRQMTSGPAGDVVREWLPDGSGVVFYRYGTGAVRTFVATLDGAPPRPLVPAAEGDQWVTVSRDGKFAAYDLHRGDASTIWVQPLDGGPPRQLTTEGLETALPTKNMWSPDSKRILFVSRRTGTSDIWTAEVATGKLTQVTSDLRNDSQHSWSPDGRWVAFSSDRGGQNDIWIAPSTGGPAVRVTNTPAIESKILWSADGQTLFFETGNASAGLDALTIGTGARRTLLSWPAYTLGDPSISPDGRTVAFNSNRSGNNDIWTVPLAGGEPSPFATGPASDVLPRYSPDGKFIAFQSDRSGSSDIWLQPVAGGNPVQLTNRTSQEYGPVWAPDGSLIAFLSNFESSAASQVDIWLVDPKDRTLKRLTKLAGSARSLVWAPDGKRIFFVGGEASGAERLYSVSVDGGAAVPVDGSPQQRYFGIDLSSDGKNLAYGLNTGDWEHVEVIPSSGGKPRLMSPDTTGLFEVSPKWLPDGSGLTLISADTVGTNYEVWFVSWPQGARKRLTNTRDIDEFSLAVMPNSREILVQTAKAVNEIRSVSVAGLIAGK